MKSMRSDSDREYKKEWRLILEAVQYYTRNLESCEKQAAL